MKIEKRGAWSVTKLLTVIMLVIVMVLVIYYARNGLIGSAEDAEGFFNKILITLGFKKAPSGFDCRTLSLTEFSMGTDSTFLQEIGAGPGSKFEVCGNTCTLNITDSERYRLFRGTNFEKWYSGKFNTETLYIREESMLLAKIHRDIYSGFYESLGDEKIFVKNFYDNLYTKRFVLYGNGDTLLGIDPLQKVFLTWDDGKWYLFFAPAPRYKYDPRTKVFTDTKEAINAFGEIVTGFDDDVTYAIMPPYYSDERAGGGEFEGKPLDYGGAPYQIINNYGDEGELDDGKERGELLEYFENSGKEFSKKRLIKDVYDYYVSNFEELKKVVDGKSFEANGKKYTSKAGFYVQANGDINQDRILEFPEKDYGDIIVKTSPRIYLINESGKAEFVLIFNSESKAWYEVRPEIVHLNHLSLSMNPTDFSKFVSERDYKLKEDDFKLAKKHRLIKDFLEDICG